MNDIIPRRRPQPVDLDAVRESDDLERDIKNLLGNGGTHRAPPVQHEDIGKLSAEAVLKQYEQTAKDVENLGVTVKEWIAKLEGVLKDCNDDLKLISDAAKHVRDKGDAIHAVIDQASAVSKTIRDTCADFTSKVGK
jgi:hypothetical protein